MRGQIKVLLLNGLIFIVLWWLIGLVEFELNVWQRAKIVRANIADEPVEQIVDVLLLIVWIAVDVIVLVKWFYYSQNVHQWRQCITCTCINGCHFGMKVYFAEYTIIFNGLAAVQLRTSHAYAPKLVRLFWYISPEDVFLGEAEFGIAAQIIAAKDDLAGDLLVGCQIEAEHGFEERLPLRVFGVRYLL
jgi:hypothetical protein